MAMDLINGRGAAPGGGPGGPPPDLAALLGAGGPPPGPQPGPGSGGPDNGTAPSDPVAVVQQMVDLSKQYLDVEKDQQDLLQMQKIGTLLQQLLAKDQQDADQVMSGATNPRALRKAFGP